MVHLPRELSALKHIARRYHQRFVLLQPILSEVAALSDTVPLAMGSHKFLICLQGRSNTYSIVSVMLPLIQNLPLSIALDDCIVAKSSLAIIAAVRPRGLMPDRHDFASITLSLPFRTSVSTKRGPRGH